MRCSLELLEIKIVISRKCSSFQGEKMYILVKNIYTFYGYQRIKKHALFRVNYNLDLSTTENDRTRGDSIGRTVER